MEFSGSNVLNNFSMPIVNLCNYAKPTIVYKFNDKNNDTIQVANNVFYKIACQVINTSAMGIEIGYLVKVKIVDLQNKNRKTYTISCPAIPERYFILANSVNQKIIALIFPKSLSFINIRNEADHQNFKQNEGICVAVSINSRSNPDGLKEPSGLLLGTDTGRIIRVIAEEKKFAIKNLINLSKSEAFEKITMVASLNSREFIVIFTAAKKNCIAFCQTSKDVPSTIIETHIKVTHIWGTTFKHFFALSDNFDLLLCTSERKQLEKVPVNVDKETQFLPFSHGLMLIRNEGKKKQQLTTLDHEGKVISTQEMPARLNLCQRIGGSLVGFSVENPRELIILNPPKARAVEETSLLKREKSKVKDGYESI